MANLAASGANSDITSITGLTTDLTVAQGGTGASTLTGILLGAGTSAITALSSSGTGDVVRVTSATMVTPTLGVATATTYNKVTITAPTTAATLTLVQGSSLITVGANAITLTSTGATGVTLPTTGTLSAIAGTETLTNKRITKRITTISSHATPTVNTDNCDAVTITAQAAAITSMTTNLSGTPTNFQPLVYRIKDNGTARAITWGASFEAKGIALPTTTTLSKVLTVGFLYDTVTSKWGCVASVNEV